MEPERRKSNRVGATIAAACRVRGMAFRTRLRDVSPKGCCAQLAQGVARPGERVLVQVGRLLVMPAVVRWVAGSDAGLEFANPLHGAMLGQLASRRAARDPA